MTPTRLTATNSAIKKPRFKPLFGHILTEPKLFIPHFVAQVKKNMKNDKFVISFCLFCGIII